MDQPFDISTLPLDLPPSDFPEGLSFPDFDHAPASMDVLPDGHDVLVLGEPGRCSDYNHLKGDNPLGFQGTCGLVSCEDVLRQFGVEVNESQVVQHAADNGECVTPTWFSSVPPEQCGGTTAENWVSILADYQVPAHVDNGGTLVGLAENVANGHGVILSVNAGTLWNDAQYFDNGHANHAVVATGVALDRQSGEIAGFYINDSGTPPAGSSAHFVDADTMRHAWEEPGGESVVTDSVKWA